MPSDEIYDEQQKAFLRAERLRVEAKQESRTPNKYKVHKTLTFSITQWALLEMIRDKMALDDFTQTLNFCVLEQARNLGIES